MQEDRKWPKETRYLALIGVFTVLIGIIWYFRGIINPLVVAAIIAYLLHPAVDFISSKSRISHSLSVIIVYVVGLLLIGGLIALLVPVLIRQIQIIEWDLESFLLVYEEFITTPLIFFRWTFTPGQFLPALPEISTDLITPLMNNLFTILEALTKNFVWVLVVVVSIYYLLQDGHKIQNWIVRLAPDAYRQDAGHIFEQLRHVWSDYLRSQLVFMFFVGLIDSIVWLAIGLPGAVILGVITGLTSFVHEIGAIVSGVLSVLAAYFGGSSFLPLSNLWFAVLVFVLYQILTLIKNVWLRPIIVGRHVHLHSGIVFLVVIAALIFHGPLAAFLVVPILVSLLVIGRYLRRRIYGLSPFPEGQAPGDYFLLTPLKDALNEQETEEE
jgi:predicted PurR-regulated permease PerM